MTNIYLGRYYLQQQENKRNINLINSLVKSTVIQQMLTDAERMHGECMEDAWRTVIHTPGPRQLKVNRIPLDKPKRFNSFCDSYLTFQHQHHQKKKKLSYSGKSIHLTQEKGRHRPFCFFQNRKLHTLSFEMTA